jgi:hypothetical protein
LAVVPASVVNNILRENIAWGPSSVIKQDLIPHVLALIDERPLAGNQAPHRNTVFDMGTLHVRQNRLHSQLIGNANDVSSWSIQVDGLTDKGSSVQSTCLVTWEWYPANMAVRGKTTKPQTYKEALPGLDADL